MFIIAMALMIDIRRVVQWTSSFQNMNPFTPNTSGVYYGPAFILNIVAWILQVVVIILFVFCLVGSNKESEKTDNHDEYKKMEK